jgi:hypothetical protein
MIHCPFRSHRAQQAYIQKTKVQKLNVSGAALDINFCLYAIQAPDGDPIAAAYTYCMDFFQQTNGVYNSMCVRVLHRSDGLLCLKKD